jgi:hypothetical protein
MHAMELRIAGLTLLLSVFTWLLYRLVAALQVKK